MSSDDTIQENVKEILGMIQSGQLLEGLRKYYAEDVVMQENGNPPTHGLQANIERETEFLANVKTWNGITIKGIAVNDGVAFVECVLDLIDVNDQHVVMEQVAVQRWKDGKVVSERFYYDASGK